MPDGYELHDAQYIQLATFLSVPDALLVSTTTVPAGKVWSILSASAYASVAETQDVWWSVWRNSIYTLLTNPASRTMNNAINRHAAFVTEGMEQKLFPGEGLSAHRAAATAGSTFSLILRYLETDLPYYIEMDRQKTLNRRIRALQATNPVMARRGGSGGYGGRVSIMPVGGGGAREK